MQSSESQNGRVPGHPGQTAPSAPQLKQGPRVTSGGEPSISRASYSSHETSCQGCAWPSARLLRRGQRESLQSPRLTIDSQFSPLGRRHGNTRTPSVSAGRTPTARGTPTSVPCRNIRRHEARRWCAGTVAGEATQRRDRHGRHATGRRRSILGCRSFVRDVHEDRAPIAKSGRPSDLDHFWIFGVGVGRSP